MSEAIQPTAVYSVSDVARLLGTRDENIYAYARCGRLRSFIPGTRNLRITGAAVLDLINDLEKENKP